MKRIFLVGYMGSGKTTIGQLLAKSLGYSFIDLDQYIENRVFKTIATIFAEQGEAEFRNIEHKMLLEVAALENTVISTGGGAACFHNNMQLMNETGKSIYLKLSVEGLVKRLEKAKSNRPLIKDKTDAELHAFISEMLQKRDPFYSQATHIIDNDNKTAPEVCDEIIKILQTKSA